VEYRVRVGGVMVARSAPRRVASSLCACTNFAVFQRLPITFHASGLVATNATAQEQPLRERARHGTSSRDVDLLLLSWHCAAARAAVPSEDSSVCFEISFVRRLWPRRAIVDAKHDGASWPSSCLTLSTGSRGRVVPRRKNVLVRVHPRVALL